MTDREAKAAVKSAAASIEMEGFSIDSQSKAWCMKLLKGEMTMDEYIASVKKRAGVAQ